MKFSIQLLEREIERLEGLLIVNTSETAIEFLNLKINDYKLAIEALKDFNKTKND